MKDHIRDYATAAYRFYAKNGKSVEKFKHRLYKQALEQQQKAEGTYGVSKPTEAAVIRAEKVLDEKKAEIRDMEAVESSIKILEQMKNGKDTIQSVEYVYFVDGSIVDKVHQAEIMIPASERSIYYWLKKARDLFASERGLRF